MAKTETIEAYLDAQDSNLAEIGKVLTRVLNTELPDSTGKVWHGHPVWMNGKTPVAGFKAYTSYVTFMIWKGQDIDDPSGTLQPASGRMASIKFRSVEDIDESAMAAWLPQLI